MAVAPASHTHQSTVLSPRATQPFHRRIGRTNPRRKAMKMISALAVVLLAALAVQQQLARADIACPAVLNDLEPCLSFLQGGADSPSGQCCAGVRRTLYAAAVTTADRRATCECLKTAYNQVHAQLSAARALPGDCGLSLSYPITPDIDCNTIN